MNWKVKLFHFLKDVNFILNIGDKLHELEWLTEISFYFILLIPEIKYYTMQEGKNLFSFLKHVNPKNQDQFTIFIWVENPCF